jgi:hypothetical protein
MRTTLLGLAFVLVLPFAACEDEEPASKTGLETQSKAVTPTSSPKADLSRSTTGDVEEDVRAAFEAANEMDVDEFFTFWTDAGLEAEFQGTRDDIRQAPEEFLGGGVNVAAMRNTTVNGADATTDVDLEYEEQALSGRKLTLVLEDDKWRINGTQLNNVVPPANARRVQVDMTEFQFIFSPADFQSGAPIEVVARNVGGQEHEIAFVKAPDDLDLQAALESPEEPEGLVFLGFVAGKPGETFNFATTNNLEPGRYVMVCFFPDTSDPAETPHALKGMTADFRIN